MTIKELATQWLDAKRAEQQAAAKRLEIERQLIKNVGVTKEGVVTYQGDAFTVKTTGKLTRTLDDAAVSRHWDSLPCRSSSLYQMETCSRFEKFSSA